MTAAHTSLDGRPYCNRCVALGLMQCRECSPELYDHPPTEPDPLTLMARASEAAFLRRNDAGWDRYEDYTFDAEDERWWANR